METRQTDDTYDTKLYKHESSCFVFKKICIFDVNIHYSYAKCQMDIIILNYVLIIEFSFLCTQTYRPKNNVDAKPKL